MSKQIESTKLRIEMPPLKAFNREVWYGLAIDWAKRAQFWYDEYVRLEEEYSALERTKKKTKG